MDEVRTDLLFVLVHYRTPERIVAAVNGARQELERTGLSYQLVVVDNSGDLSLSDEPCTVIAPGCNLGYAGAANLAFRRHPATYSALCNPDVELRPGCLSHLLAAVEGCAAVGPAFFWDTGERLQLPPTEQYGAGVVRRMTARLSPSVVADRARRSWRRLARRHWLATEVLPSEQLSGALLLFDSAALQRVGPLDENFRLYFEETDWLRRAHQLALTTRFVPQARAIHSFDASAQKEPLARAWFAESEALFRQRYGLHALPAEPAPGDPKSLPRWPGEASFSTSSEHLWFEVSATPRRIPAASERVALDDASRSSARLVQWRLPEEVRSRTDGWFLTVSDDRCRELGVFRLEQPEGLCSATQSH